MARENYVSLHGQVLSVPRIYINKDGEATTAMFIIQVIRRTATNKGFSPKIYKDCPVIRTKNKEIIEQLKNIQCYDMVDIKGVITTKPIIKSSNCPNCEQKNSSEGAITFVTPIYICKRESLSNELEGLELLKERNEVSNLVNVIGNLCKQPQFFVDANNKPYASYEIAVNRRYHIKEDDDDAKTDYPWIKTYGTQALEDSKCLTVGSSVYISGALQSREVTRKNVCKHCGAEYSWSEEVLEIVPYYIGYLANCLVSENTDTDGD